MTLEKHWAANSADSKKNLSTFAQDTFEFTANYLGIYLWFWFIAAPPLIFNWHCKIAANLETQEYSFYTQNDRETGTLEMSNRFRFIIKFEGFVANSVPKVRMAALNAILGGAFAASCWAHLFAKEKREIALSWPLSCHKYHH